MIAPLEVGEPSSMARMEPSTLLPCNRTGRLSSVETSM